MTDTGMGTFCSSSLRLVAVTTMVPSLVSCPADWLDCAAVWVGFWSGGAVCASTRGAARSAAAIAAERHTDNPFCLLFMPHLRRDSNRTGAAIVMAQTSKCQR